MSDVGGKGGGDSGGDKLLLTPNFTGFVAR